MNVHVMYMYKICTGSVGEGSDHIQLIKFRPSCAPARERSLRRGEIFFAPPYYSQRVVFASLWALFSLYMIYMCCQLA